MGRMPIDLLCQAMLSSKNCSFSYVAKLLISEHSTRNRLDGRDSFRIAGETALRCINRCPSRMLKSLSESFDGPQDERRGFDIIEDLPFMLRLAKYS